MSSGIVALDCRGGKAAAPRQNASFHPQISSFHLYYYFAWCSGFSRLWAARRGGRLTKIFWTFHCDMLIQSVLGRESWYLMLQIYLKHLNFEECCIMFVLTFKVEHGLPNSKPTEVLGQVLYTTLLCWIPQRGQVRCNSPSPSFLKAHTHLWPLLLGFERQCLAQQRLFVISIKVLRNFLISVVLVISCHAQSFEQCTAQ